tara:strand:- start:23652 stop:24035 length:384 start_codon:yes stop_codon:yes gene_type:complete
MEADLREISINQDFFLRIFKNKKELSVQISGDLDLRIFPLVDIAIKKNIKDFEVSILKIDMEDLEFEGSRSILQFVSLIRSLLISHERIFIYRAPQIFAHTLYRTNMLDSSEKIVLLETKKDVGYAG